MDDENQGTPTSEESVEEQVEETNESEQQEESLEELKARLAKAEEERENQKRRAEKAEKKAKSAPQQQESQITAKDILALQGAGVTADDFDEVQEYASYKGVSVTEALQSSTLKNILNTKAEERKTAAATQTKSPRGVKPKTGDDYLSKAEQTGEVPESEDGMREMIRARIDRKRKSR